MKNPRFQDGPTEASGSRSSEEFRIGGQVCRAICANCDLGTGQQPICADHQYLHEHKFNTLSEADFLRRCRAIHQNVDQGLVNLYSPYLAQFLLTPLGRILDIDARSASFLRASDIFSIRCDQICIQDPEIERRFFTTLGHVSSSRQSTTLLIRISMSVRAHYVLLMLPTQTASTGHKNVTCYVFPLGRRRIASARQLMSMFALTAAEARLARALCHGETLEAYGLAQGIKLTTVKTQLRAIFSKTQTDRQVSLVNLIVGIPPLR